MKLEKKLIIVSLILLSLFMIGSVSATSNTTEDIINSDVTHEEKVIHKTTTDNSESVVEKSTNTNTVSEKKSVSTDNTLKMHDTQEKLTEHDDFIALNETINGNKSKNYIELEKDYHDSYDNGNGIQINRENVVIDGKGHTIDCTGQNSRIFNILVNGITLKNIIFTGGYSDCGGAIYTNKYLKIINCTFKDNQATATSSNYDDVIYGGGAIYANNKMSIYNCTFINNHANSNGGAIAAVGDAPDDYEIFNCTFIHNTANNWGGAFYSHADKHMGNIINSTFINNQASAGDAIYNYGDYGTIDRCIFVNNTANSMIYAGDYAKLIVNNSIIVNNYGDNLLSTRCTLIMDNNWWGTTVDDEAPVISGDTPNTYYILNMTVDEDSVDISLNNLYDNEVITTHCDKYALPSINFIIKAKNIEVGDSVVLGTNGEATIEHPPSSKYEITIGYNGVELTRDVKPSFKWLKDKINDEYNEISLDQDCIYDLAKDSSLTNGIEFAKDMTIDGQGHIIDARGLKNIFYFDDDTNSYSLTLKNIIFANATTINNGAAVYFKGNKIEIINCTFINNKAESEGDAIYIANALSNANKITKSAFIENTGSNSVVHINLDSNAELKLDNSIFMKNSATKNINGTPNVTVEYSWFGNTIENNNTDISKTENVNVTNWLFLKIDANPAMNGNAIISLNNIYNCSNGKISTYTGYALQPITFDLSGVDATTSVLAITLNDNGQANYQFRMDRIVATLMASYNDVTTNKEVKYDIVDDGSFRALNEIIFFSDDGAVIELTHDYVYFDNDTLTDGIVIPRKITINGNGHTIDAKGKTRIFWIPEGVSDITINNISFINAKASHGSVIVINKESHYFSLLNCNFTNNNATNYGGVIDCVGDYCTINNCNFINNRAVDKAGVIRYYHTTQAYINNSNFINNKVADGSDGGGVIYVDDGAVDIDKSTFINNIANDKPGSIFFTTKPATITNSIFLNNHGVDTIHGGSGVELTNNWFGNTSSDYNSFADTYKTVSGVYHETTLNNWLYLDINFVDDYAIISLNNEYIKSSNSTGVISNYNLPRITLTINSTTLGLNTKVTLDNNGKVRVPYTKTSDDDKLTASNEYVSLTKDVIVYDFYALQDLINENDVIELKRDYTYNSEDPITNGIVISKNVTINGNGHTIDANGQTRIFNITKGFSLTLINVTLKNANSLNQGGAIYNKGELIIINSTLENNTAKPIGGSTSQGGAIYNTAKTTIINSTLKKNNATNGSALWTENGNNVTLIKVKFIDNAGNNPITNQSGYIDISDCKFLTQIAFKIDNISDFTNGTSIVINVTETLKGKTFNGNVTINIGDNNYIIELINGSGNKTVTPNLKHGKYTAKLIFNETDIYESATSTSNIFNVKTKPEIEITSITQEGNGFKIELKANSDFTDTVNIIINGVQYPITITNGLGITKITPESTLKPNTYNATINYQSNENYADSSTNKEFIAKYPTHFTITDIPDFIEGSSIEITITESNGYTGPVNVIIGSETHIMQMNNGYVKESIKPNLKPGTYTATIKFNGNNIYYTTTTNSNKFTITKKTEPTTPTKTTLIKTKITAKNKTFKRKTKIKKYKITLKAGKKVLQKVKVYLTIKGKKYKKTYKVKTNKKGQAIFKIKKLSKKGTYKAVISYKGTKKTVKIIVK